MVNERCQKLRVKSFTPKPPHTGKHIPLEIKHEAQSYPRYKRVGQPSILSKGTFLPSAPELRCAQWKCFTNHVNFNEGSQAKQLFRRSEVISLGQSNHHALQPWERSLYLSPSDSLILSHVIGQKTLTAKNKSKMCAFQTCACMTCGPADAPKAPT